MSEEQGPAVEFTSEEQEEAYTMQYVLAPGKGDPYVPPPSADGAALQQVNIQGQISADLYGNASIVQMLQNGYNQIKLVSPVPGGTTIDTPNFPAQTAGPNDYTSGTGTGPGASELLRGLSLYCQSSTQVYANESSNIIKLSPLLQDSFSRGRVVATDLHVFSNSISTTSAVLSGQMGASAVPDIRGLDFQDFSELKTVAITDKDGRDDIPLADGCRAIMGPDIGKEYVPVDVDYSTHTGKSGQVYFKGIKPNQFTFIGDKSFQITNVVIGSSTAVAGQLASNPTGGQGSLGSLVNYEYGYQGLFPDVSMRLFVNMQIPANVSVELTGVTVQVFDIYVSNVNIGSGNTQLQWYCAEASHALGRDALAPTSGQGQVRFSAEHRVYPSAHFGAVQGAPTGDWSYVGSCYYLDPKGLDYGLLGGNAGSDGNISVTNAGTVSANYFDNYWNVGATGAPSAGQTITALVGPSNAYSTTSGTRILDVNLSVEITFGGLYEQGVIGPARVISWNGAGAGQIISVVGASKIQVVANTSIAPYIKAHRGTDALRSHADDLASTLSYLWNSPSILFKRIYSNSEYMNALDTIKKNPLHAILRAGLSHGRETAALMGAAANAAGVFSKLGGMFNKIAQVGKKVLPIVHKVAIPLGDMAAQALPQHANAIQMAAQSAHSMTEGHSTGMVSGNAAGFVPYHLKCITKGGSRYCYDPNNPPAWMNETGHASGMVRGNATGMVRGDACGRRRRY